MQFTFTREIIPEFTHTDYGYLGTCSMFTISNEQGLVGKFFHSRKVAFVAFADHDIRIDYIHRLFRRSLYPIIDQKTGQQIGNYELPGQTGIFAGHAKLFLRSRMYKCKMLPPAVKRKVFRKDTWGYYTIEVSNYPEVVTYDFRIENLTYLDSSVSYKPFKGNISMEGDNLFLLFAGILLIHEVLTTEDSD